jgi:hypothetical protein
MSHFSPSHLFSGAPIFLHGYCVPACHDAFLHLEITPLEAKNHRNLEVPLHDCNTKQDAQTPAAELAPGASHLDTPGSKS